MPPHSSDIMYDTKTNVNGNLTRDFDQIEEKPTSLVEIVRHLPKDVFEKRPLRAYMGALQVYIKRIIFPSRQPKLNSART